jgi:peptidoglycan/xylan/chitin deacetylase (PgdA/CDA1 family)
MIQRPASSIAKRILAGIVLFCSAYAFQMGCGDSPDPANVDAGSSSDTTLSDGTATPDASTDDLQSSDSNGTAESTIYFTFAVNCHDWLNIDKSNATLDALIDIFEKYGVKGDFYFTPTLGHYYEENHPELIQRLISTKMGIGFHLRAPHPYGHTTTALYTKLREAADPAAVVYEVESQRLDLTTGELIADQPGGLLYMKKLFGFAPSVATPSYLGGQGADKAVRNAAYDLYYKEGARMIVANHEGGSSLENPYAYEGKMLKRPSHFSVTRWDSQNGNIKDAFWWNHMDDQYASDFDPVQRLKDEIAKLPTTGGVLFGQSLIHENNYYMANTPWGPIFYEDKNKTTEKSPPFDLSATAPWLKDRTQADQDAILANYDALVAYASSHPRIKIVTAKQVVELAEKAKK